MSLNSHQEHQLIVIEAGLILSAPHLAAAFDAFSAANAGHALPAREQVPSARQRLHVAAIQILPAIAAVGVVIVVLAGRFLRPGRFRPGRFRPGRFRPGGFLRGRFRRGPDEHRGPVC
jgi:hypothetical protein